MDEYGALQLTLTPRRTAGPELTASHTLSGTGTFVQGADDTQLGVPVSPILRQAAVRSEAPQRSMP